MVQRPVVPVEALGAFTSKVAVALSISVTGEVMLFGSPKRKFKRNWSTFRYWRLALTVYLPGLDNSGTVNWFVWLDPGLGAAWSRLTAPEHGTENCTLSEYPGNSARRKRTPTISQRL